MSNLTEQRNTEFLDFLVRPGEVHELRAFEVRRDFASPYRQTVSGYFDNREDMSMAAANLDGGFWERQGFCPGVYLTVNPVDAALLARANNKLIGSKGNGDSAKDANVTRRSNLFLDFDPVRTGFGSAELKKIMATDFEKAHAFEVSKKCLSFLKAVGFHDPAVLDSGNGYQFFYGLDWEVDEAGDQLIHDLLTYLNNRFGTDKCHLDCSTANRSRICKFPGSWNRKGDQTKERPYRRTEVLSVPEQRLLVPRNIVEALVPKLEKPTVSSGYVKPPVNASYPPLGIEAGSFEEPNKWSQDRLEKALEAAGISFVGPVANGHRLRYNLDPCPFNEDHTGRDAVIFLDVEGDDPGRINFKCFHDGCKDNKWPQFKALLDRVLPEEERSSRWEKFERGEPISGDYSPPKAETNAESGRKKRGDSEEKPDPAAILVRMALDHGTLFRSLEGVAYMTVATEGKREHYPVGSSQFATWIAGLHYDLRGKSAKKDWVAGAVAILTHLAGREPKQAVYLRTARIGDRIYIDLCDERRGVVEITGMGWKVRHDCPVKFTRPANMGAMPVPEAGSIENLRPLMATTDANWILLKGFILSSLQGHGPYFHCMVSGEQGSAKSTATKLLKAVVDPCGAAPLRNLPEDASGFAIRCRHQLLLGFDNVSKIDPEQSDSLCGLATGGGFSSRKLYTDDDEVVFDFYRPAILNGIPDLGDRGDLLQRSLLVLQPAIPDHQRQEEGTIWENFRRANPGILGGICDLLSRGLNRLDSVKIDKLPRMADATKWVTACLGNEEFLEQVRASQVEGELRCLENSVIYPVLMEFLADPDMNNVLHWRPFHWEGTATELLDSLRNFTNRKGIERRRGWPEKPNTFTGLLRRDAPAIRKAGKIMVDLDHRTYSRRTVKITPVE